MYCSAAFPEIALFQLHENGFQSLCITTQTASKNIIWYLDAFLKFTQKYEPYQFTVTKEKSLKLDHFHCGFE